MLKHILYALALSLVWQGAQGGALETNIPMRVTKASTYYIDGYFHGYGAVDLMVDTGSSYTTINETTLEILRKNGAATYVKDLTGIMADGSRKVVPVYKIAEMRIGAGCTFKNVEAAVFPGNTRYILGISTLKKAAPFTFSMDPPSLLVSNCGQHSPITSPQAKAG